MVVDPLASEAMIVIIDFASNIPQVTVTDWHYETISFQIQMNLFRRSVGRKHDNLSK